ncbi:Protein pbn1 [Penicillium digitatum PHI26]|uniref:Protein PBN1 n=2 Tax=Penicillium digitatum TaxID=36651 RepID=K9FZU9_PEND2|nr:Protein pbn1 [Penicillium digitatum Pd1]EKV12875.1 Protein pbn1 [Penicillium digitatum Pd1]EKV14649.1 Protein pbn1 [Penicillium digitatum PHI26]
MKRRITLIQRVDAGFDPQQAVLTASSLSIRGLDAAREDRITIGLDKLPEEASFITPPPLSTRFASSASLQFYTHLPSIKHLVEYIQNTVCDQSRTDGPECHTRADALLSADSVDIDYDSSSHALTVSGLWTSPPTGGWTDQFQTPASDADQIEFGLLGAEAGLEPEEIKMGGLLAVVGQDKKLKPTMFSFPSRHQPLTEPSSYTVSFAPPTGLHPTMSISMPRSSLKRPPAPSDATCALHTYLTLPSTIFGDQYQLATTDPLFLESHKLVALRALAGEMDLEAPDWVVQRWGSNWLLELTTPPETEDVASIPDPSNWTSTIPLHLRYLPPSETGHRTAHVPWPVVFWACTTEDDTKMGINPFDRSNLGWDSLFGPRTLFYQLQPAGDRLVEEIDVPVLRLTGDGYFQGKHIELGTCVVISLGFMWVLWRLVCVAWPSGAGSKRAETAHNKKEE